MTPSGCAAAAASVSVGISPAPLAPSFSWNPSSRQSLQCSRPPTQTAAAMCCSSSSSWSTFWNVRTTSSSSPQQKYCITRTTPAATRLRLDRLCTSLPPSHLAVALVGRDAAAVAQSGLSNRPGTSLRQENWSIRQTSRILGGQQQQRRPQALVGRDAAAAAQRGRCNKPGTSLRQESGSSRFLGGQGRQQQRQRRRPKAKDDDFEIDDDGGFDAAELVDLEEEEEEDFRDYETEYEAPMGYKPIPRESDSLTNTEGESEEIVVAWKINEEEFHKINLLTCDFFIRKVPDPDNDVYDFREMYVTPPDMDIYSIPKVMGKLPKKPVRCTSSNYEYIHTTEPPVDEPRSPLAKTNFDVMKVFLMRHMKDRRAGQENFMLDFEEIYVIDCQTQSFYRADVKLEVPGGKGRDRTTEVLIVRDDGASFRIIREEDEHSPDQIVQTLHWERTREAMENYLRGFRDYETSNWF